MSQQHRHLAAILFTDIVGYTAMMQKNEEEAVRIMKRYGAALQKIVAAHSGQILNDYGDGNLCSFSSAVEAVSCVVELQKELQLEPKVPLRIGLHVGEIFFEDGKVMGDGVNIASRIQSLGQANTILFSSEINNKIKNHPQFNSVTVGKFEFKNVDEAIEVFALANDGFVVPKKEELHGKLKEIQNKSSLKKLLPIAAIALLIIAGLVAYKKFSREGVFDTTEKTIAILPFKNISINKEENEPFCVGVALELQKKIELLGALIPIAPQSVERFRDTKLPVNEIASQLGNIKYIVQGTVQRDGNKVMVFVSLIDAANNQERWSGRFPGEVKDIFSLQEDVAQQIASSLKINLTPDEQSRMGRVATRSTAAIDAYNDALTSYVKLVSEVHPMYWDSLASSPKLYAEYQKTLSLCDKVITADPAMAEAYVLKGQTYHYSIDRWSSIKDKFDRTQDSMAGLARKAIELDESSAEAYVLLSQCFQGIRYRDYEKGDSGLYYLKKALDINPNNFDVNWQLGAYYALHDPEKGVRFCKKAIRLNPLSIRTPDVYRELGFSYHCFGNFEKAEFYGKKAIELAGNSMAAVEAKRGLMVIYNHWGKADSVIKYSSQYIKEDANFLYELAETYCNLKNDCSKAAEEYKELWNRYNNHTNFHRWAVALIYSGKIEEGREKLKLAFKEYENRYDTLSYDYAGMCAMNGEKEKSISILKKFDWKWGSPYLILHDRLFDNIRNEREFKDLVQKVLEEKKKLKEKIKKMEDAGEL